MSKKEVKHPEKQASTGAYSTALIVDGWVYISGQGPIDMAAGTVIPGTIEEETELTLKHLDTLLKEAGCSRADVVKCTCHLKDIADFDKFNGVYHEFFKGSEPLPTRTTVQSVLWGDMKVEIDAIAKLP